MAASSSSDAAAAGPSEEGWTEVYMIGGGLAAVVAALYVFSYAKEWWSERAQRKATAEAAALRKQPRAFQKDDLLQFNGKTKTRPLLLALKGRVLDVREGADYYGPGGPYQVMAGRDASKAFAMMSLKEEDAHPDVTGVDADHMKILQDWYDKLSEKYPTVGSVAGNTFGYTLEQAVIDAKKEITKKYD